MPIWFIAVVAVAFLWLLIETDWLTVQLPYGLLKARRKR